MKHCVKLSEKHSEKVRERFNRSRAYSESMEIRPIAVIRNAYDTKFGIPRQSGLVKELVSEIVFEPEFRVPEAFRGLETFEYIWLIWGFSETANEKWSPTVRPPRMGGNRRMGVFATRSPFRPNPLGLSSVRLAGIDFEAENGPVIYVTGADLMNGTPIYDIKPYLEYADSHADAGNGFTEDYERITLRVRIPENVRQDFERIPEKLRPALIKTLEQDPRPSYQKDPERQYGVDFGGFDVKFVIQENVLTILGVSERIQEKAGK